MSTPAKLYGKDISEYDEIDVESLLSQLSAEEISILAKEVDPDVSVFTVCKTAPGVKNVNKQKLGYLCIIKATFV